MSPVGFIRMVVAILVGARLLVMGSQSTVDCFRLLFTVPRQFCAVVGPDYFSVHGSSSQQSVILHLLVKNYGTP